MNLAETLLSALATVIILTVHEYAHGYAAYLLGDNTARNLGRLTLNPLKHIDPIGAICMVFFHFGWAKPVPINMRNFKNPRRDFAITALAGPLANLVMAFLSAPIYLLCAKLFYNAVYPSETVYFLVSNTLLFVYIFHVINIGIALFNLIPIPPLDGSRILGLVLPPNVYYTILRNERRIYFILLGWLALGPILQRAALSVPLISMNPVLSALTTLLSLPSILSFFINLVSDGMMFLWQLIPFLRY